MDHLSVGLNSVPQSILVRRLLLRQLRVTLNKGQIFSLSIGSFPSCFLLIAGALLCHSVFCRSVVSVRGAVLCPQPGPTLHREDDPLPVCAQQCQRPAGMEWRNYSVRWHLDYVNCSCVVFVYICVIIKSPEYVVSQSASGELQEVYMIFISCYIILLVQKSLLGARILQKEQKLCGAHIAKYSWLIKNLQHSATIFKNLQL